MLLDSRHGSLVAIPNVLTKLLLLLHPFPNQTSKSNPFTTPKADAISLFLIANDQKLRFYQNKGLSPDEHCEVPNTFSTYNQTSKPRIKIFLSSMLD